jgi:rhodanese-related sulfurtransferase
MDKQAILKQAAGLVLLAVALATVSNVLASPKRHLKWIGDKPAEVRPPDASAPEQAPTSSTRIDTERAFAEWSAGSVFLDARVSDAHYDDGHIAGSIPMAVWEGDIDDRIMNLMVEYQPEQRFVVYCTGGACEDSDLLRQKLRAAGFEDVLVYLGGFPAWAAAGHPVE